MPRRDRFDDDDDRYDDRPRRRDDREDESDEYDDRVESRRRSRSRYDDEDRYGNDRRQEPQNGPASASLVLGILSIVGGLTAIPGLIAGFMGISKAKTLRGAGKGTAVTGTILSGVGVIVLGLTIWLVVWWMGSREDTRSRYVASNNLKEIGLAMHNDESAQGTLVAGIARSRNGGFGGQQLRESELQTKLSWRVDLLPYIEQNNIYQQFNTDQPWDSAQNRPLANVAIRSYSDPDAKTDPSTRWRSFYGKGTTFDPQLPNNRPTINSIWDGTSNTIFVVESGQKVTWSQFNEIKFDPNNPPNPMSFGREKSDIFQVLMFDGSVRNLKKSMSPMSFGHMITSNGGEVILDDFEDGPQRGNRW